MAAVSLLIVIYLRVSTEEQARRGYSLPDQLEACRAKAAEIAREAGLAPGCAEITEFVDTFGGDVLERPVLEDLRTFVKARRPAWFICMDPDRFSRNLTAQLLITDEIERVGTNLAFVQHNYEKTAEGRLFYQLRGAVAEFEKAKILERTARGKRGKLRAGRRSNGVAPFGYRHNPETDELLVYDPEAEWVRQIFRWLVENQWTTYQIAHRLNELSIPTKKGGKWREGGISYILRNTTYIGQMVCNKYDTAGKGAYRRLPREKREALTQRIRPESEWLRIPVPSIIDEAAFNLAQERMSTFVRRGRRRQVLLSMLLRCSLCGASMTYNLKHGVRWIRCNRRYADLRLYSDATRCQMPHHRAEPIEEAVWGTICHWLTQPDLLEQYLQEQSSGPSDSEVLANLGRELGMLERHMADKQDEQVLIIQKQLKKLLTEAQADRLLTNLSTEISRLESHMAEVKSRYHQLEAHLASIRDAASRMQDVARAVAHEREITVEQLTRLNPDERRHLVRQIVRAVIVRQDGTCTIVPA